MNQRSATVYDGRHRKEPAAQEAGKCGHIRPQSVLANILWPMRLKTTNSSQLYSRLAPLVVLCAIGPVLHGFLPHSIGTVLIALRLVLIPGGIVLWMFTLSERILFAAAVIFTVFCEILLGTSFDKETFQFLLSVLASLPFLKAGAVLGTRESAQPIWWAILFSALALNALTIGIYINTLCGGSMAAEALAHVGREGDNPLVRFALGNAIEIPALLAIATVTSALVLRSHAPYIALALILNLGTAFISQSRIVLIISGWALLGMWRHFRPALRFATIALLIAIGFSKNIALIETSGSIVARFAGNDAGSAADRSERYLTVFRESNLACFTIGNGFDSSRRLMAASGLGYQTVEAVPLQLFYEMGLARMAALGLFMVYTMYNTGLRFRFGAQFLFVVIQSLFLLPVMTLTPLYIFFAGTLCVTHRRRQQTLKGSQNTDYQEAEALSFIRNAY